MGEYPQKLWTLFRYPDKFLKSIEKEKRILPILWPYAIMYIVVAFLSLIFSLPDMLSAPDITTPMAIIGIIVMFLMYAGFAFAMPFLISGIAHLGVLILGGKQGFFNTFKPMIYGSMIVLLYGLVNLIITGIILPFTKINPYAYDPIGTVFSTSFIIVIVINALIALAGLIHALIVETKGVAKFQKFSNARAFSAIFFLPLAFFVVLIILFAIFLVLITVLVA